MWWQTALTAKLGVRYPIIQGPFGGGLSSVELAAAVSNAGGLGSFGAHHLGPDEIVAAADALRGRTAAPFAINLWISNEDPAAVTFGKSDFNRHVARMSPYFESLGIPKPSYPKAFGQKFDRQVEALINVAPPVFSFVYGVPRAEVMASCKSRKIVTIGTATSVEEATALEAAGVDAIVVTGLEAGGHRVSFLRRPEDSLIGTLALVQLVEAKVKCPVIAAGGIASGRAVAAMLALGAAGAQIGTAFLACDESGASAVQRSAMFAEDAATTVLTRVFTGRLARSIANRMTRDLAHFENDVAPYPVQGWLTGRLKSAAIAQDRPDLMSLWAGQATPLLRHRKAGELFAELIEHVDAAFERARNPLNKLSRRRGDNHSRNRT